MTSLSRKLGAARSTVVRGLAAQTRRRGTLALAIGIGGAAALAAIAPKAAATAPAKSVRHHGWMQVGRASWYGKKFNGRRTALGDRFDMAAMTCAHRTLALGSWVKVTNLHNKRSVILRVNDRGPVSEGLIVDLSMAAAHRLGISGLGSVKLEASTREAAMADRAAHAPHLQRVSSPLMEMASNAYGVPVLPPSIADR